MSILIDKNTRVVVQGITGGEGSFHTDLMNKYGTNVVAGVTPGKKGEETSGVPVYDTVKQAVKEENADTSVIFVPPAFASDAIMESLDADIELVVAITEGIPVQDMMKVKKRTTEVDTRLVGPNCPGVMTPGESKIGIMPGEVFEEGKVGVVSRSGTLTYELVDSLTERGIGQSTIVGIGGDPIIGTDFVDVLEMFEKDDETHAVVMIGEIGGSAEEEASEWIEKNASTPIVGFIAGRTAPPGKRMGHAGAIVSGDTGTAETKINALESAGVKVGQTPREVAEKIDEVI